MLWGLVCGGPVHTDHGVGVTDRSALLTAVPTARSLYIVLPGMDIFEPRGLASFQMDQITLPRIVVF